MVATCNRGAFRFKPVSNREVLTKCAAQSGRLSGNCKLTASEGRSGNLTAGSWLPMINASSVDECVKLDRSYWYSFDAEQMKRQGPWPGASWVDPEGAAKTNRKYVNCMEKEFGKNWHDRFGKTWCECLLSCGATANSDLSSNKFKFKK